jgi:hypothetical protein
MFARSMLDDILCICLAWITDGVLWESNMHLFVRARTVLPIGSQFTQAEPAEIFLYPHMGFHVTTASGTIRSPVLDTGT